MKRHLPWEDLPRLFQDVIRAAPAAVIALDAAGRVRLWNPSAERIFGWTRKEVVGEFLPTVPPSQEQAFREDFAELLAGKIKLRQPCRRQRKDGTLLDVTLSTAPLTDSAGTVYGIIAFLVDVTAQRKTEKQLQKTHGLLNATFAGIDDAVFVVDPEDRTILLANPAVERIFGYPTEEVLGRNTVFLHKDRKSYAEWNRLSIVGLNESGVYRNEWPMRRRNGDAFWAEITVSSISAEKGWREGVVSVIRDVSARKETEERLRRLTAIIEATPDFVSTANAEGGIEFINPAGRQMMGLSGEQPLGEMKISDVHPPWASRIINSQGLPEAVRVGYWRDETAILGPGGEEIPVSQVIIAHRQAGGKMSHSSTIMRDIRSQKRAHAELQRLNRTLRVLSLCNETLVRARSEEELRSKILHHLVESGGYAVALSWFSEKDEGCFTPTIYPPESAGLLAGKEAGGCGLFEHLERICRLPSNQKIVLNDRVLPTTEFPGCRELIGNLELRGAYSLPLKVKEVQLGCLVLFSGKQDFSSEEIFLLKELADDLAFGIQALRIEAAHRRGQETLRLRNRAIEASINGVMICEATLPDTPITYVNPAFEKITGYDLHDVRGRSPRLLSGRDQNQKVLVDIQAALAAGRSARGLVRNYRKDGNLFWNHFSVAPVPDAAGRITHFIGIMNDVTESKRYEEELAHKANHDELTGLANRNLLADRLKQGIAHARRTETSLVLFLLDLDRFQIINDSLGHNLGNDLLKQVAERLKNCVRSQDTLARLGGDEFVALFQEMHNRRDTVAVVEKIRHALAAPFEVGGQRLHITASLGISSYPQDGRDGEILIRNADIAMYHAKDAGKDTFQFFAAEMDVQVVETMRLEADLRQALEREEFLLHFQPKVEVATGRIVGGEALVRWRHPERGMVSPGAFIPLAEQTGLIGPLGEWVLRETCRQNKAFQDAGMAPLALAVNVSARQFRLESFPELIDSILKETGLEARWLDLELTESMLMDWPERAIQLMARLKEIGVGLCLDDFGTGYSSLNYLRRFPMDRLKIDRSFITDVATDPGSASVATSIVAIAHNLGMKVVAEGVENEAQLKFLQDCRCDSYQGFLFSRPVPPEEFAVLLKSRPGSVG